MIRNKIRVKEMLIKTKNKETKVKLIRKIKDKEKT